jgi:hypothetical protein
MSRGPWYALEDTRQRLFPGVDPVKQADRVKQRAAAPLQSTRDQKPCDLGLFDQGARDQIDLIDLIKGS